jgi:hypothetical protein
MDPRVTERASAGVCFFLEATYPSSVPRKIAGKICMFLFTPHITAGKPLRRGITVDASRAPRWIRAVGHGAIEAQRPLTIGMTVVDWWGVTGRKPNVHWMNTVDADLFDDLLTEKLAHLP